MTFKIGNIVSKMKKFSTLESSRSRSILLSEVMSTLVKIYDSYSKKSPDNVFYEIKQLEILYKNTAIFLQKHRAGEDTRKYLVNSFVVLFNLLKKHEKIALAKQQRKHIEKHD